MPDPSTATPDRADPRLLAAESRLQAAEIERERLRSATDAAGVGIWDFDLVSGALVWDDHCRAAFGVGRDAPVDYALFLRLLHPDDRDRTDAAVQAALDPHGAGRFDAEFRVCGADGVQRWIRSTGRTTVDRSGAVPRAVRFIGTVLDITAARAAEAAAHEIETRFRLMADQVPVMLWAVDAEGRCTYLNERWYAFTGQAPETALGLGWLDAVHPDDAPRAARTFADAVAHRTPFHVDYRLRAADGAYRWASDSGTPRLADDGTFLGFVGSVVDITERHAAALERERLLEAERVARRRTEQLQQLTAALAEAGSADDAARVLLEVGLAAAGAHAGAVTALSSDGRTLTVLRAHGYPAGLLEARRVLPIDARLPPAEAARTGEPLFLQEEDWDDRYSPPPDLPPDDDATAGRRAWAVLPLRAAERLLGVWALSFRSASAFDAAQRAYLMALAAQGAQAMERARLRDEEREARERLALAQTAARIGSFDWDVTTGRVAWTVETERLFGMEPGAFRGTYADWRPLIHPEDVEPTERALADAAARGAREMPLAFRVRRLDGAIRWIEGRALLTYAADGTLARVIGTNVDVTERRTAEERAARLQELTTVLSGAVAIEDVARHIVQRACAATGSARTVVMLRAAHAPDQLETVAQSGAPLSIEDAWGRLPIDAAAPLPHAVRTGEPVWAESRGALLAQFPDPRVRRYVDATGHGAWAILPLRADDRLLGALMLGFDEARRIAEDERRFLLAFADQCGLALERARLYEAERLARAGAEAANRAKSEFLAVMSHELRTPLNAIGGYTELMAMGVRGPVTELQLHDLTRIQASQRHLLGLINEVLNYARIESGAVRYDLHDVALGELLTSVEPLVRPQLETRGLTLRVEPGPPGLLVRADSEKVRQVLLNLLSNAVKFTDGGGHLTLHVDAPDERRAVRVRVTDTGIGIPADKLAAIFDPFVQVDASLTRTFEGTGLGLAISRDLARGMGGDLTVESRLGVGSTFTLTLPGVGAA